MDETDISLELGFAVRMPDGWAGSPARLPVSGVMVLARDAGGVACTVLVAAPSPAAAFGIDLAAEFTLLLTGVLAGLATALAVTVFDADLVAGLAEVGSLPASLFSGAFVAVWPVLLPFAGAALLTAGLAAFREADLVTVAFMMGLSIFELPNCLGPESAGSD